jgi:tetratricopeptide (TPR) repeat protein
MATKPTSGSQPTETVTPIWHGLAAVHKKPNGEKRVRLRWLRLFGIVLAGGTALWLMIALGLYFWFKLGRGFQDEQFADVLLLPFRYEAHNHKLGEYYIGMGDSHLKNLRIEQAFNAYRLGVMKAPENLHGRRMLADFFYIYYRNELGPSLKVLEDGLPYAVGSDKDYVNNYLLRLQQGHFPEKILEVCQRYVDGPDASKCRADIRTLFALNLAQAYIDQGRFDDAESIIDRLHLDQTLDGTMLASRLLWERGRLRDATAYLEKAHDRFGNNDYIFGLLSRYYRDLGDMNKSYEYILKRQLNDPSNAMPRIEMLYILMKTGEVATVAKKVDTLIEQFHSDKNAMSVLDDFAMDQGDADLALRLYKNAQDETMAQIKALQQPTFDVASYAMVVAQSYLAKNDYQNALKFLDDLDQEKPHWLEPNRIQFDSLRALADYGLERPDLTTMYLNKLVKSDNTRPDTLIAIANRFLTHGGTEQAQMLFQAAYHLDPHNQAALAQLIIADLQLGNSEHMNENLTKLLETRRPPLELLFDAYRALGSDRFIFVPDREHLLAEIDLYIQAATKNRRPS